jgi:hypothetical protein
VVHDVNDSAVPRSSVNRAMRRRDAISMAILVALGLSSSDAGQHLANAAKKETNRKPKKPKDQKNGNLRVAAAAKLSR